MDIYQIIFEYNPPYSSREICFALLIISVTLLTSIFLYLKKKIMASQAITIPLLVTFLLIVLGSTVFGRSTGKLCYELTPFWSYGAIIRGVPGMLKEVLLNCVLLFPAGILLPPATNKFLKWYHGIMFGVTFSGSIEVLQLILRRGLFEFDDIIHNSIGCMIGCVVSSWIMKKWKHRKIGNQS